MEIKGPLSFSQRPTITPYPETDEFSPSRTVPSRDILILSSYLCLISPSDAFSGYFLTKILQAVFTCVINQRDAQFL